MPIDTISNKKVYTLSFPGNLSCCYQWELEPSWVLFWSSLFTCRRKSDGVSKPSASISIPHSLKILNPESRNLSLRPRSAAGQLGGLWEVTSPLRPRTLTCTGVVCIHTSNGPRRPRHIQGDKVMRETEPEALLSGTQCSSGQTWKRKHTVHMCRAPGCLPRIGQEESKRGWGHCYHTLKPKPSLSLQMIPDENSRLASTDWRGCLSSWKQDQLPRKLIKTQRNNFFYCLFLEKNCK